MTLTKAAFGDALMAQMSLGYDPLRLARWAYVIYLDHANELEPGLYEELMKIATMGEGPEFELSQEEVEELAESLLRI